MTNKEDILTVGENKGEMDFGVRSSIADLTYEEMQEFRATCMVAIGVAEDMWRDAQRRLNEPKEVPGLSGDVWEL